MDSNQVISGRFTRNYTCIYLDNCRIKDLREKIGTEQRLVRRNGKDIWLG